MLKKYFKVLLRIKFNLMVLFLTLGCTSIVFADFSLEQASVIGCKQNSTNHFVNLTSTVDILDSYLNQQDLDHQKTITEDHINQHINYLIGLSKKFKSDQILKFVSSAYRKRISILSNETVEISLPSLDRYWESNVSLGNHPYILYLQKFSKAKTTMRRISYSVDLMISSCTEGEESQAFAILATEIQKFPVPRDPFLGFWINPASERTALAINSEKKGSVPNCLSLDLLFFNTSPEFAWYYWQLGGEKINLKCASTFSELTTQYKLKLMSTTRPLESGHFPIPEKSEPIKISLIFGQTAKGHFQKNTIYTKEFSSSLINSFNFCSEKKIAVCLSHWSSQFDFKKQQFESTQRALIFFSKYLNTFLKIKKIKQISKNDSYLLFEIEGESKLSKQPVLLKIFNGPTGVGQSYLAPPEYWNFLYESLFSADVISYYGHSSAGYNLKMQSIESRIKNPAITHQRTKDLLLGFFNCESQSYYGYDFEKIFDLKKSANLYLLASTGVEAKPEFIIALVENYLKSNKSEKIFNLSNDLVTSNDFMVFQKIQYSR